MSCGRVIEDNYNFSCSCRNPSFLRTNYSKTKFNPTNENTLWRFKNWLPVNNPPTKSDDGKTVVYKSKGLCKELGLKQLYIAFNGYWPEKEAKIFTGTFKGLEAPPTIIRAKEKGIKEILIATAGNTGRAFAEATVNHNFDIVIVAPQSARNRLWTVGDISENSVKLITMKSGNDYTDAINLGAKISDELGVETEGGAKNVARRDGMGTCFLEGINVIGEIPRHYFQAIGSGTGGIAAWEAAKRVITDGRFGKNLPVLHLSQNKRFAPMVTAWTNRRDKIIEEDLSLPSKDMVTLFAEVLANRTPPYSISGGVYDALSETNGNMYSVSEVEAQSAMKLMADTEEIDIIPPAAIAIASLIQAVDCKNINSNETILLNITGGGHKRLNENFDLKPIQPILEVPDSNFSSEKIQEALN